METFIYSTKWCNEIDEKLFSLWRVRNDIPFKICNNQLLVNFEDETEEVTVDYEDIVRDKEIITAWLWNNNMLPRAKLYETTGYSTYCINTKKDFQLIEL